MVSTETLAHIQQIAPQVSNPTGLSPAQIEKIFEQIIQQRLPGIIRQQVQEALQASTPLVDPRVETLTQKVTALEVVAKQLVELSRRVGALEPLLGKIALLEGLSQQKGETGPVNPTVAVLNQRVGMLETEFSKVSAALLSHQNHIVALKRGVEVVAQQTQHNQGAILKGQQDIDSLRKWTQGMVQVVDKVGMEGRKVVVNITALDKKVDTLISQEALAREQLHNGVESALQKLGQHMQDWSQKALKMEREISQIRQGRAVPTAGPSSSPPPTPICPEPTVAPPILHQSPPAPLVNPTPPFASDKINRPKFKHPPS
jgi:hypothetical protein